MEKTLFWEALSVITSVPARNYLFKVSNWSTRTRYENYSGLRLKTLERCQWPHSSVFIVNCKDISIFVLIFEFEQVNVCRVHMEKSNTFEGKIAYTMRHVVVFSVWTKSIEKWHLNLYYHNPTDEIFQEFTSDVDSS